MRTPVVVGYGMVGHRVVRELRDRDGGGGWRVVVLGEERRPAYDRVALSSYVRDWRADALTLPGADFAGDALVTLRLGDPAVAVDTAARTVVTAGGHVQPYDALVLATGSRPFVPPVPGHDLPGCFVYRTLEDLDAIRAAAAGARTAVVVGGGLLGLEAANALAGMDLATHVVEMAPRLMPLQVDEGGGALLRRLVERLDLTVHTGASTAAIRRHGAGLVAELSTGAELAADLVVFSAGVRPRDELAREAGLPVGERGGIAVDATCRTAAP